MPVPGLDELTATVARWCYPHGTATAVITSGGGESNVLGLRLAQRDAAGAPVQTICSADAHASIARAVRTLGMLPLMELESFDTFPAVLAGITTATAVVAPAGAPLREIARICRRRGTWLHVDAAHLEGPLNRDGLELADSIALDMRALGRPIPAALLVIRDGEKHSND
jgi:L-2,4-diaminobutyrate decarboxylase